MKKILLVSLLSSFAFANCLAFRLPVNGSIYSNVTDNATLINKDASQKDGIGNKTGESCASSVLGIIATGDSGIKAAAVNGNIKDVKSMDFRYSNVIGSVYVKQCTQVYGD